LARPLDLGLLAVGSAPILYASFAVDDVPTDPTAVTFKWRIGTGSVTTYTYGVGSEITKTGTGEYQVQLSVATAGRWYGRWAGTGTPAAASEVTFGAWTNF